MHKRHENHEEEAGEKWLLPYSDLMTLLLAVFIVLFAVSKIDVKKAEEISKAFQGIFSTQGSAGIMPGNNGLLPDSGANLLPGGPSYDSEGNIITPTPAPTYAPGETESSLELPGQTPLTAEDLSKYFDPVDLENLQKTMAAIETYLNNEDLNNMISVGLDERGLVLSLSGTIMFDSGSADIKPEYGDVMLKLGQMIKELDNNILVEGHTDNVPINNAQFSSNRALSYARAMSVIDLFYNQVGISQDKMSPVAYGEYRPIADNSTPEGRAKNRRVDIIIINEKYSALLNPEGTAAPAQ